MKKCLTVIIMLFAFSVYAQANDYQCITESTFINLIERCRPSVVSVEGKVITFTMIGPMLTPYKGTGFVLLNKDELIIVTNKHVVKNMQGEITARVANGESSIEFRVKLIRSSHIADLAILKPADNKWREEIVIPPLHLISDSNTVRDGEWVLAVGNPHGLGGSVAYGIISNKSREMKHPDFDYAHRYIQVDMNINQGNSGGPLLNLKGKVVGMVTLLSGSGIGAAIPANIIAEEIALLGKNVVGAPGWLGLFFCALDDYLLEEGGHQDTVKGLMITLVSPDSPAAKAGLEQGDVIVCLDGEEFTDENALRRKITGLIPGDEVVLTIVKPGQAAAHITVKVEKKP